MRKFAALVLAGASAALAAQTLDRTDAAAEAKSYLAAEQRIRARLALDPGNSELRALLARSLTQQQKFDAALVQYRLLAQQEPGNADHRYAIGLLHLWRGAPVEAIPEFDQARALAPGYEAVWRSQIDALEALGGAERERAANLRQQAVRQFPGSRWEVALASSAPVPALPVAPTAAIAPVAPAASGDGAIGLKRELALGALNVDRTGKRNNTVEVSVDADRLSNGGEGWRGTGLQLTHRIDDRHLVSIAMSATRRFGLHDSQVELLYSYPLSARLTGSLEASFSPGHQVLPRRSAAIGLQYEFAPAWLVHGALKNTSYSAASINQASLTLEHYFASYRLAAIWRPTRAFGTVVHGGEVRFDRYYGDASSIGIAVAAGQEAATLDGGTVAVSDIRSIVFNGRHWIDPDWALHYEIGRVRQGDAYTRQGVVLGVQRAF